MNNFNKAYKNLLESTSDKIVIALICDCEPLNDTPKPKFKMYVRLREEPEDTWTTIKETHSKITYERVIEELNKYLQQAQHKHSLVFRGDNVTADQLFEILKDKLNTFKDVVEYWDVYTQGDYSYFDAVGRASKLFNLKQFIDKDEEDISKW